MSEKGSALGQKVRLSGRPEEKGAGWQEKSDSLNV